MNEHLELLLDACTTLKETLQDDSSATARQMKIHSFIEKFCTDPIPIGDFEVGLEWFNCGEPLSLGRQLRGKIVILDFFTYCCINCLHILPHLRELEERFSVEDGVVIVGVHSAKFDNEKDSANILAALRRYDITHPVVNDCEGKLWSKLGISCWPTVLVLGPKGQPIFELVGEFHKNDLCEFVSSAVDFFETRGELLPHLLPPFSIAPINKGPLLFPGKVTSIARDDGSELIAIANTGLHTIIVASGEGLIKHIIGGTGQPGFADGNFSTALFNAPQGIAFSSCHILFVADTENHAIRKVDLLKQSVVTVAGNGQQAESIGCNRETSQSLSSPWDLCFIRRTVQAPPTLPQPFLCICPPAPPGYQVTPSQAIPPPPPSIPLPPPSIPPPPPSITLPPPSIPPPPPPMTAPASLSPVPPLPPPSSALVDIKIPPQPTPDGGEKICVEEELLVIAMAGSHQIWALFFQDTTWWGKEFFPAGTCANIAGSGVEANRNNNYPKSAAFAQPSGLTYCAASDELFIADSESSSVRCISMKTGKVAAVVGGSKTPDDLFSFGDIDGSGFDAKLQHPLGVAWHDKSSSLFVADSYNHKIKSIKFGSSKLCVSYIGTGHAGNSTIGLKSQLNEPGGICVSCNDSLLYIADTNNHSIKVFNFETSLVTELNLRSPAQPSIAPLKGGVGAIPLKVKFGGKINLHVKTILPPDTELTDGAPQRWILKLPDNNWKVDALNGIYNPLQILDLTVTAPPSLASSENVLQISINLFVCAGSACKALKSSTTFNLSCDTNAPSSCDHSIDVSFK